MAIALMILGASILWPSPAAHAAGDGDSAVRWSIVPAGETGPDGRRAVEVEIDPGDKIDEHFAVQNISAAEVVFSLTAADGFYTQNGRFDILAADEESSDAGTWISLPDTVTVPAGETVVVPFSIEVPHQAEPGDHAAGITASILSVRSAGDGTSVGVESRVGFRVLARVTGQITPAAALTTLGGWNATSWNPLRPGEVTVTFDVENNGNTRLLAEGSLSAGGRTVDFPAEGESPQELLPGDTRELSVVVDDVWPLFLVPATVTLTPVVLTMSDDTALTIHPVTATTVVWAMPWPQLVLLSGIALIVWAIVSGRRRSRRRLDQLLLRARNEARQEVLAQDRRG
jgi:hypothetical protein